MKNILNYAFVLISMMTIASCDRYEDLKVSQPDFDVYTLSDTYNVGDTIRFILEGKADVITFYSGEVGDLQLSFASQVRFGSQENQLRVMASSDFNGDYTESGINTATWHDITDRFLLGINTTLRPSGTASITDLVIEGHPLYIAFRYVGEASATATQRNWWVNHFKVDVALPGSVSNVALHTSVDWKFVNFAGNATGAGWGWSADGPGGRLLFDPAGSTTYAEGWAIADPIDTDALQPGGVPIKAVIDRQQKEYHYVFNQSGMYNTRFEAVNVTALEEKKATRTISITIEP
ncbi:DUF5017 domain-containing protein [Sphingobacterium arenae]|uniref:DUF5017 domain-containing protein n=1 Tax=Sphingobacterium arenae TaxID=1280598 RepID=A0ABR7Y384_9SPHI|nr:DUF5017 domain-containing protein [Sphingobacterium arenae]MBD1425741.1 DUF5017 domain-containing protein [Sphingobacterium arenae]